jgi:hypothetical protein
MAGFLNTVKSIAVPVAKIAAQLLPEILMLIPAAAGRAAASGGVVKTGMVDWVPDSQKRKIYAANATTSPIVLAFAQQTANPLGTYDVESFAVQVAPRNAYDSTAALNAYGAGSVATNYLHPVMTTGGATEAVAAPLAQIVKYIPLLAANTFLLFGGGIRVSRGTKDNVDFWEIKSMSRLMDVAFNYLAAGGNSFNFNAKLQNPPSSAAAQEFTYNLPMDGLHQSTGLLSEFSLTINGESSAITSLLTPSEQIPFDQLPAQFRAQLAA